jgi:hypothetical protein
VAELAGKIVGARVFLRWQFRDARGNVTEALRPVDTVTHPEARGRGIFKRLTLTGLAELHADERYLVFNTPNGNSLPGYLKMGWEEHGRAYRYFYTPRLAPWGAAKVLEGEELPAGAGEWAIYPPGMITTHKTDAFLRWRYTPDSYRFVSMANGDPGCLVVRTVRTKGISTLSVTDYVGPPANFRPLVLGAASARGHYLIHMLAGGSGRGSRWWPGVQRGSSLVAIRPARLPEGMSLHLSAGDLESIL